MVRRSSLSALVAFLGTAAAADGIAFEDWFLEDADRAGMSGAWLDAQPYADGYMPLAGENVFTPGAGPSCGDLVKVRATLSFDDVAPTAAPSDAQAAVRLNGERFQVLTAGETGPVWTDVAAEGVPVGQGIVYELAFDLDYAAGDYGVTVACEGDPVAFSAQGAIRFRLVATGSDAVGAVSFTGYGGAVRIEGACADSSHARAAAIRSFESEFGADFGVLDARVVLDTDKIALEDDLVWTLSTDAGVVTGACDRATGAVTFAGLALRRSEDNACMLRAVGSDGILCRKSFTVRSGRVVESWICEDEEHAGETGTWRSGNGYEDGEVRVNGGDGFRPTLGASDGNRVTVKVTGRFGDGIPMPAADGAQLAIRLNGDTFQVWSGMPPAWRDVAAEGVAAEPQRDYAFVFEVDYGTGDYGVSVVSGSASVPLAADGETRFPLVRTGTNAVSEVCFGGDGAVASIYGEFVDASVARADGVRYDTLADATASGRPVTVTWAKAVSGDALANAARGSDLTLPACAEPTSVRLAPGVTVRPAASQLPGLLSFLSPASWFDVVTRDGAATLALNASATPEIGSADEPALVVEDPTVRISVANAKPGLSYALSSVTNLADPFAEPKYGWQRFDGTAEGTTTLTTEMTEPAAFYKVFVSDR